MPRDIFEVDKIFGINDTVFIAFFIVILDIFLGFIFLDIPFTFKVWGYFLDGYCWEHDINGFRIDCKGNNAFDSFSVNNYSANQLLIKPLKVLIMILVWVFVAFMGICYMYIFALPYILYCFVKWIINKE